MRRLAGAFPDGFPVEKRASVQRRVPVAPFHSEFSVVKFDDGFDGLLSSLDGSHKLGKQCPAVRRWQVLASHLRGFSVSGSGGTGRRTSLRGWRSSEHRGSNPRFRTIYKKGQYLLAFLLLGGSTVATSACQSLPHLIFGRRRGPIDGQS